MTGIQKIGAVGGALALALCWPLAVGHIGQTVIEDSVNNLTNHQTRIEIVEYQRGYLSSQMQLRYQILDPSIIDVFEELNLPIEYVIDSQIQHGILSLSARSHLPQLTEFPIDITSQVYLNGSTDYQVTSQQWQINKNEALPFSLAFSPFQITGNLTTKGETDYQLSLPSLDIIASEHEYAHLDTITAVGKGKPYMGLWVGEQQLDIAQLSVFSGTQMSAFEMGHSQHKLSSQVDESRQRLNASYQMALQDITFDNLKFNQLTLGMQVRDLDLAATKAVVELHQADPELSPQTIDAMLPYFGELLTKGMTLSMDDIRVVLPEGMFNAHWRLTMPEGLEDPLADPTQIVEALEGEFVAQLDKSLLEAYPVITNEVDNLLASGVVVETEQNYQVNIQVKEGNLVLANGEAIPIFTVFMMLLLQSAF